MTLKRKAVLISLTILAIFLTLEATGYYLSSHSNTHPKIASKNLKANTKSLSALKARNNVLKNRLAGLSPKGTYIVVDTALNKLYFKKGGKTLKEIVISAGSGSILKDPAGNRKWVFDTPRGELSVQSKTVNPVWIKPDWAFIEEGEPVPQNFKDRVEEGVLGEYALSLGNSYLIHGTLYTRLLGRNVTHGCIRVGDEDLQMLYNTSTIGTKVIIF
jgi:L,D-transpeptidase YbiS